MFIDHVHVCVRVSDMNRQTGARTQPDQRLVTGNDAHPHATEASLNIWDQKPLPFPQQPLQSRNVDQYDKPTGEHNSDP